MHHQKQIDYGELTAIFVLIYLENISVYVSTSQSSSQRPFQRTCEVRIIFIIVENTVFALFTLIVSGQRSFPEAACYMTSLKTEQTSTYKK